MAIKGATFDLQTVLAKYDGAMYNALSNNHNGYVSWTGSGNPITFTDTNVLTLKNGYILVHGRLIVVDGATDITLNPGSSISSGDGRLVLKIDTSRTNTQTVLNQVEILQEYKATSASWRALSTDDINALSTGVYEVQLCHFTVSNGTSSGAVVDISTDTLVGDLQADIETLADSVEATGDAVGTLQTGKANAGMGNYNGNLNDLKTAGWYFVASGVTNAPATATAIVEVVTTTNNNAGGILQRWVAISTGIRYQRQWTSTLDWTSWVKEVNSVVPIADGGTGATAVGNAFVNIAGMNYSSATDFNNIRLPGIYSINPTTTTGNNPTQGGDYGQLLVFCSSQDYTGAYAMTLQIFTTLFGEKIFTRTFANGEWRSWKAIRGGDIIQVTMTSQALSALTATRIKWGTSTLVSGTAFGSWASDSTYITLPKGMYRFTTHFVANPSANGFLRTCLKIGSTSTSFVATDHLYAGAGTGSNSLQIGINASEVVNLTASTNIYFLASSQNALEGFTANVQIERLG